jgi:hypothetical protein
MERERATQQVVMEDGREGVVISHDTESLRVKVRFEDGSEEWIDLERVRPEHAAEVIPPRELGS